jgi:pilus assembly protein CpaE
VTDARIVTVGPPMTFRQQIARALEREADAIEWMPTVTAVEGAIESQEAAPNVVVLSPAVKELDAFGLAEFLGRASPATAVLLVRDRALNGTLPAAMRAGIRDVVDLSKGGKDLEEALQRAITWSAKLRSIGGAPEAGGDQRHGRIFSVFSSKGGTGKTFLATNLATAISVESQQDTAIVDLDLDLGDVFSYFGKDPARPLQDLILLGEEANRSQVEDIGTRLGPHLWGFGSPPDPAASAVNGEAMGKVLQALRRVYDHVVVDATADYSDAALAAFDLSEQIFLISALDVVGIRHLSLALQTLLSLGFPRDRFRVVLNRADSKVGLSPLDVERVMKVKVDTQIPSSRLVPVSLNRGEPVVLAEPRSDVAKSVLSLARRLAPSPAEGTRRRRAFARRTS